MGAHSSTLPSHHPNTASGQSGPTIQSCHGLAPLACFPGAIGGGEVIAHLTTHLPTTYYWSIFHWFKGGSHCASPSTTLKDGEACCWLLLGKVGQLGVRLPKVHRITHVTIEHAVQQQVHVVKAAPRKMILWGLVDGKENLKKFKYLRSSTTSILCELIMSWAGSEINEHMLFVPLATFDYNIHVDKRAQFSILL